MRTPSKRLYVLCDLEGASGISPENRQALAHGSAPWSLLGRPSITSDVLAVCDAADQFGIDEIILNDSHDSGHREPNVLVGELPGNVRVVRRPYLPGKPRHDVRGTPFGIVIVGQHAMHGGGGFAPHTIQSPPIGEVTLNGIRVGEIGLELALFMGAPLLAIVGERTAVQEAQKLCPNAIGVPVKSLEESWFPSADETRPTICNAILDALHRRDRMSGLDLASPYRFTLKPAAGYRFDPSKRFFMRTIARFILLRLCAGRMSETEVCWETNSIIRGLYALQSARGFLTKSL